MSEQLTDTLLALLRNPETPDWILRDAVIEFGEENVANVYVVCGQTGEYSDHHDWSVKAFLVEEHAKTLCDKLNQWCVDNNCNVGSISYDQHSRMRAELDPDFSNDYTGTEYFIQTVALSASPT